MLNLINILTLSTALTTQPISQNITLTFISQGATTNIQSTSDLKKEDELYAFQLITLNTDKEFNSAVNYNTYTESKSIENTTLTNIKFLAIGYNVNATANIAKYKEFNTTTLINNNNICYYTNTLKEYKGTQEYTFTINIRSTTFMEELLTALTTAVQSAVSIFVEGFGGLTQIFYNGTEITFIGGILIVGLAVMFLMMFLRWIVSFVKGI